MRADTRVQWRWLVCLMLAGAAQALAAPGDVDQRFGVNGKVVTTFSWEGDYAHPRLGLEQSDGKIVIGGIGRNWDPGFALLRFHSDGSLDSSFGDDGRVVSLLGNLEFNLGFDAGVRGLVQQADGKLVAGGRVGGSPYGVAALLVRYDVHGKLDPSFGIDGEARVPLPDYIFLVGLARWLAFIPTAAWMRVSAPAASRS